ncbi:MAG TPA: MEDS domain-containing protein [Actinomycetota bacterium]|nr:MEDS domain-containing protein [Actinomycetota bacterium]
MAVEADVGFVHARHVVQFYDSDQEIIRSVADYLARGLARGEVAVLIATDAHAAAFEVALAERGFDVQAAWSDGTLKFLNAAETVEEFLVDGVVDPAAFDATIGSTIRAVRDAGHGVCAYGEMVALLWESGNVTAAIDLERLWNGLLDEVGFSLFCAYPTAIVADESQARLLDEVCALHTEVFRAHDHARRNESGAAARPAKATQRFACAAESARDARHFAARVLRSWGRDGLVEDVSAVVTELASNAVLHAATDFDLDLSVNGGGIVRLAVSDRSSAHPQSQQPSSTATSGRGLLLVAALTSRWGIDSGTAGKTV